MGLSSMAPPPTHAVISIGGNDVREILHDMGQLNSIIKRFHDNYSKILNKVLKKVPNVVLIFQYKPAFNMDRCGYGVYQAMDQIPGPGDSVFKINQLMQRVYVPVLNRVRRSSIAILDLPKTFDIYDDELFCRQIEPSAKGGALIAKLLSHTISKHDFSGRSRLYLCRDGEVCDELNDEHVRYDPGAMDRNFAASEGTDGEASLASGNDSMEALFASGGNVSKNHLDSARRTEYSSANKPCARIGPFYCF